MYPGRLVSQSIYSAHEEHTHVPVSARVFPSPPRQHFTARAQVHELALRVRARGTIRGPLLVWAVAAPGAAGSAGLLLSLRSPKGGFRAVALLLLLLLLLPVLLPQSMPLPTMMMMR